MKIKQSDPAWNEFIKGLIEAYNGIEVKQPSKNSKKELVEIRPMTQHKLARIACKGIDFFHIIRASPKRGFISLKERFVRRT